MCVIQFKAWNYTKGNLTLFASVSCSNPFSAFLPAAHFTLVLCWTTAGCCWYLFDEVMTGVGDRLDGSVPVARI